VGNAGLPIRQRLRDRQHIAESQARRRQIEFEDKQAQAPSALAAIPAVAGEEDGKTTKERESQIPALQERLRLAKELFDIDREIMAARLSDNQLAANRLEYEKKLLEIASEMRMVKLEDIPDAEKALKVQALAIQEQLAFEELLSNVKKGVLEDLQKQSDALAEIEKQSSQEISNAARYEELLRSGINPALAKATIEVENRFAAIRQEFNLKTKQMELEVAELEAMKERTKEQEKYLELLKQELVARGFAIQNLPEQQAAEQARQQQLLKPKSNAVIIAEGIDQAGRDLAEVTNSANMLITAANGIGDAFGKTFTDIVTGAQTWRDGLAGMFESVASMFADMVAQMLAKWAALQILNMFNPGGAGAKPPIPGSTLEMAANGAVWQGGFTPFANGGVVNGPHAGPSRRRPL
jgi:hypothetical protein